MGAKSLLFFFWAGTIFVNASEDFPSHPQKDSQQLPLLQKSPRSTPPNQELSVDEALQQEFGDFIIIVPREEPQLGVRGDELEPPKCTRPIPRSPRVPLPLVRSRKLLPGLENPSQTQELQIQLPPQKDQGHSLNPKKQNLKAESVSCDLTPPVLFKKPHRSILRVGRRMPPPPGVPRVKRVSFQQKFVDADEPNHRFDSQIRAMRRACVECIEIWNQMCLENRKKPIQLEPDEINPENLDEQDPISQGMHLLSYRIQIAASCLRDGDWELFRKVGARRWYSTFYDLMKRYGAFMWRMTRPMQNQAFDRAMRYLSESLEFDLGSDDVLDEDIDDDNPNFREQPEKKKCAYKKRRRHHSAGRLLDEDEIVTAPVEDDKQTFCGDVDREIDIPIGDDYEINQAARAACEFLFQRSLEELDERENARRIQFQEAVQSNQVMTQKETTEETQEEEDEGIEIII